MKFWKYQGAGNDFVMVDQRKESWLNKSNQPEIEKICNRRFGIGADGLILLENHPDFNFEMVYFNADGRESSMCGNGGRCIAAFANHLDIVGDTCRFLAIDGPHEAKVRTSSTDASWVELKMTDVTQIEQTEGAFVLNTGSPHYVRFVDHLAKCDMVREGQAVRYSKRWEKEGINVNLAGVNKDNKGIDIRTYERGVEDETLACGTGVTAAAISSFILQNLPFGEFEIPVHAIGGDLSVRFTANPDGSFTNIWLCGPAERVFEGTIHL